MYAIIRAGGKQYQVEPGSVIHVDLLSQEEGSEFSTKDVLLFKDGQTVKVGTPVVEGVVVKGVVEKHVKGQKLIVFKMKRRKNYRRTQGHRQQYTRVKIESIES